MPSFASFHIPSIRRILFISSTLLLLLAGPLAWIAMPSPDTNTPDSPSVRGTVAAIPSPVPTEVGLTPDQMLERSWSSYRRTFIQNDGRTIDPFREQATTSEGQSYALLRAVWMNDRAIFDTSLRWTNNNLRVRGDHLFGYLWGKRADNSWGIIDPAVASDADQDIALALIIAARRWGDEQYLAQARDILRDLWATTVVEIRNRPYMTAGDWAARQDAPTLNPSYLAPYAYRMFAEVDTERPWASLIDTSYEVITSCSAQPLDQSSSANLPPNWCAINRTTGAFEPPVTIDQPLDTHFGYDAFRTYWRVAIDAQQNNEPRAIAYLQQSDMLRHIWKQYGVVSSVYRHDGPVVRADEDPTIYGGLIANLLVTDRGEADTLVATKVVPLFVERDGQAYWSNPDNYYLQNWMWFGLALYADRISLPQ